MLSADDFTVREKAETTLRRGGSEALVILEQLVRSDDPEVRTRAPRNATPTKTHGMIGNRSWRTLPNRNTEPQRCDN